LFTIFLIVCGIKAEVLGFERRSMISEEIVYVCGIPQKVVVFLHGYQDCAEHIERKTIALQQIDGVALHIPQAPFVNEVDSSKKQWFSIRRFDPEDRRRTTSSWDEFVEYYNKMTLGLEEANHCVLQYVDSILSGYGLGYEDLILCGFSQGAMCALYSGLMCPHKIGGVISFSGILAASGYIEKHYKNRPECLLLHGMDDDKIRPDALAFTKQNLKELGCRVKTLEVENMPHKITEKAMDAAKMFIRSRFV